MVFQKYAYMFCGTFLMAVAYKSIYDSAKMVTGGFSGISIIVKYMSAGIIQGGVPLWVTNMALNIPLFIAAFSIEGKKFTGRAVIGAFLLTVFLAVLPSADLKETDYFLASVFGGVLCGVGVGLVLKAGATTGGTEMMAVLIHKRIKYISIARLIQLIDAAVIAAGVVLFGLKTSMYAVVAVYISSVVTDSVLEGGKRAYAVLIVSEKNDVIADMLLEKLDRGVTSFPAKGVYSQKEKNVLLCVVSGKQIPLIKELVWETDNSSFLVVGDVREVFGEGFVQNLQ
jgi:uncharacterized membrane-anchored protein YitT (DUF2179 family)